MTKIAKNPSIDLATLASANIDVKMSKLDIAQLMAEKYVARAEQLYEKYREIMNDAKTMWMQNIPKRFQKIVKEAEVVFGPGIEVTIYVHTPQCYSKKTDPKIGMSIKSGDKVVVHINEKATEEDKEAHELHQKRVEMMKKYDDLFCVVHRTHPSTHLERFKVYVTESALSSSDKGMAIIGSIDDLVNAAAGQDNAT